MKSDYSEGLVQGASLAKKAAVAFLAMGLLESIVGVWINSIVVLADSFDAVADAAIFTILWLGLKLAFRQPNETYNYGYLRFETLAGLFAGIGILATSAVVGYAGYTRMLNPAVVSEAYVGVLIATLGGVTPLFFLRQMNQINRRFKITSIRIAFNNTVKDTTSSVAVIASLVLTMLGVSSADGVGGLLLSFYIGSVAYVSIKESSRVLLDVSENPALIVEIKKRIGTKYRLRVSDVKIRKLGPYLHCVLVIQAPGGMTLKEIGALKQLIGHDIDGILEGLGSIDIDFRPMEDASG